MALIHRATLTPSKLELLNAWLPGHLWYDGAGDLEQVGAYRFDDPAGEVGLEAFVLRARDGALLHVPVTYRAEPLEGADDALIGTSQHSVLGRRWVYDGCADPVWILALASTALTGGAGAEELVDTDGRLLPRDPTVSVVGSGTSGSSMAVLSAITVHEGTDTTIIRTDALELVVVRTVGIQVDIVADADMAVGGVLTGRWADGSGVLAALRSL